MRIDLEQARELARRAAAAAGADERTAASLARATVAAEVANRPSVGFSHLFDYLDGFVAGRIAKSAQACAQYPAPTTIRVDAKTGIAQLGFDLEFDKLVEAAKLYGVSLFLQWNSYTVGELGYYTRRLAHAGLLSLACSNGPALVTTAKSGRPVYGTNPLSFAAPVPNGRPLVIDQASSATAFVNVRDAASRGESIPEQWALDALGEPTTDARQALHGMLLAFGGARGANIALMVEVLSAGLTGANWSLDAPAFQDGDDSPGAGLFIVAISPDLLAPELPRRLAEQMSRLKGSGIYMPGNADERDDIDIPRHLFERLQGYGAASSEAEHQP